MSVPPSRPWARASWRSGFVFSGTVGVAAASVAACGGSPEGAARVAPPAATADASAAPSPPVVVVDRTTPHPRPTSSAQAAPSSSVAAGADAACDPFRNLVDRREGDLHVAVEPPPSTDTIGGRLRSHSDGSLAAGSGREWVGPRVPRFVPLHEGSTELHLLETTSRGYVAGYRDPYGAGSCELGGSAVNCRFVVTGYDRCGKRLWSHDLGKFMSRGDHLEVQDLRATDDAIYFNEACQSYARESGGKCSSLVAVDPVQGKLLWRSQPLVSNNRFLVVGKVVVTGYGFTSEPDALFLLRKSDGKVMSRQPTKSAHQDMTMEGELVAVTLYPGDLTLRFRIDGADGDAPRLVPVPASKTIVLPPIGFLR